MGHRARVMGVLSAETAMHAKAQASNRQTEQVMVQE